MLADKLYRQLTSDSLIGAEGSIHFQLNDISVKVRDVSVVGNILQEWLADYMKKYDIYFRTKSNTQDFPDFLLSESDTENLLEVKSFTKSPNFDVANFAAYARSLREHPYRLDAKYLIFKYSLNKENQNIVIEDIWLKDVLEICRSSERAPINLQWKQGDPVNIRPGTWYSKKTRYPMFANKHDFLQALSKVIGMSRLDSSVQKNWLSVVEEKYQTYLECINKI